MPWTSETESGTPTPRFQGMKWIRTDLTGDTGSATTDGQYWGFIVGLWIDIGDTAPAATWDFTLTDFLGRNLLAQFTEDGSDVGQTDVQEDIVADPQPVVGPITLSFSGAGASHGDTTPTEFHLLILKAP